MSETPLAIGIDFGGTSVKAGVVRGREIIDQAPPIATQDFDGSAPLMETMIRAVGDLRARHDGIVAVGIGMPGFVDFEKGIVAGLTNVRGWENIPLKAESPGDGAGRAEPGVGEGELDPGPSRTEPVRHHFCMPARVLGDGSTEEGDVRLLLALDLGDETGDSVRAHLDDGGFDRFGKGGGGKQGEEEEGE